MYQSQINRMYVKHDFLDRVYQGDILRDLNIISWDYIGGECQIKNIKLPYAVVMTQDCDLDRDYENRKEIKELESEKNKNVEPEDKSGKKKEKEEKEKHDKYVPSILICPAYLAESLKEGNHLNELGQRMECWNSKKYSDIIKQNNDRFHYLEENTDMQIGNLIIDFKHYYTIPRDVLYSIYSDKYLTSLNQLFREQLSQRFVNYFSRIGLPHLPNCTSDE